MPRIPFNRDPAWTTIGEGIGLAFAHWRATIAWWAIPVLVLSGLTAALTGLMVTSAADIPSAQLLGGYGSYEIDWPAIIGPLLPGLALTTVLTEIVGLVAYWVYYGLAITGLRGGSMSMRWVAERGLRAFVAGILTSLAAGAAVIVIGAGFVVNPAIGFLAALVALPLSIVVGVRIVFWPLAIFDGAGIREGLDRSLALSRGAWERLVGWALAAIGLGLLVGLGASVLGIFLHEAPVLESGVKAIVQEAYAVFQLFLLGVLYESQRRRVMPGTSEAPVLGAAPWTPAPAWGGTYGTTMGTSFDQFGRPIPTSAGAGSRDEGWGPPLGGWGSADPTAGAATPPPDPTMPPPPPAPPRDPWRG